MAPKRKRKKAAKHIGFDALARRVEREYLKKGYSLKRARSIGKGTAGRVYRAQLAAKKRRKS